MWSEFKGFLLKTNALALAIAFILGVALAAVVNSLVADIIMPPSDWLWVASTSRTCSSTCRGSTTRRLPPRRKPARRRSIRRVPHDGDSLSSSSRSWPSSLLDAHQGAGRHDEGLPAVRDADPIGRDTLPDVHQRAGRREKLAPLVGHALDIAGRSEAQQLRAGSPLRRIGQAQCLHRLRLDGRRRARS